MNPYWLTYAHSYFNWHLFSDTDYDAKGERAGVELTFNSLWQQTELQIGI